MISFDTLIAFWIFLIGLCIGSFINVVVLRGLSGESIVFPPSKCPKCNNHLKWWMNIPVISYLFLLGKCHYCKTKISPQYPIVEFLSGVLFLSIFIKFSYSIETIFYIIAASILLVMTVTDLKESVIIDFHAYMLIIAGIIYSSINGAFLYSLTGALFGFILYELFARSGYLFVGQRAFGEGDSLIAAGIGAYLGWQFTILSFGLSVLITGVLMLPYFFYHSYKTGKRGTCISLLTSICLIAILWLTSKFNLIKSFEAVIVYILSVITVCFFCAKQILSDMNKKDENGEKDLCMLPFGPAMAASFIIIIFSKDFFSKLLSSVFQL